MSLHVLVISSSIKKIIQEIFDIIYSIIFIYFKLSKYISKPQTELKPAGLCWDILNIELQIQMAEKAMRSEKNHMIWLT